MFLGFYFCEKESQEVTATAEWKYLFSPSYPKRYANYLDCRITINTFDEDSVILLQVVDLFLERGYDFLNVEPVAGEYENKALTGYVERSAKLISQGSYLNLHFKTDVSAGYKGFHLRFKSG